jgi:hypothetical protein
MLMSPLKILPFNCETYGQIPSFFRDDGLNLISEHKRKGTKTGSQSTVKIEGK